MYVYIIYYIFISEYSYYSVSLDNNTECKELLFSSSCPYTYMYYTGKSVYVDKYK